MNREALKIGQLEKSYSKDGQQIRVLKDFSLTLKHGEFTAVHGPSGCGKTTLLLIAGGLLHPDAGTVEIDNLDIWQMTNEERRIFRAQKLGFVFQQYHLIPYLTVMDNICAPAIAHDTPIDPDKLDHLLSTLGLKHRLTHMPAELSAGEKQRTALARALIYDPSVLLADEITGNLDEENISLVMNTLETYRSNGGAVLLVTHDKKLGEKADQVIELTETKTYES